jgi:hypothetical protein
LLLQPWTPSVFITLILPYSHETRSSKGTK